MYFSRRPAERGKAACDQQPSLLTPASARPATAMQSGVGDGDRIDAMQRDNPTLAKEMFKMPEFTNFQGRLAVLTDAAFGIGREPMLQLV